MKNGFCRQLQFQREKKREIEIVASFSQRMQQLQIKSTAYYNLEQLEEHRVKTTNR